MSETCFEFADLTDHHGLVMTTFVNLTRVASGIETHNEIGLLPCRSEVLSPFESKDIVRRFRPSETVSLLREKLRRGKDRDDKVRQSLRAMSAHDFAPWQITYMNIDVPSQAVATDCSQTFATILRR